MEIVLTYETFPDVLISRLEISLLISLSDGLLDISADNPFPNTFFSILKSPLYKNFI
jgi:hypothetical protein